MHISHWLWRAVDQHGIVLDVQSRRDAKALSAQGAEQPGRNSRQPTRRRERQMKRFKSARQAQRFLAAHEPINNLFDLGLLAQTAGPAKEVLEAARGYYKGA